MSGYLPLSGGTMTSDIILPDVPSSSMGAIPKEYALPITGGTLTGPLTVSTIYLDANHSITYNANAGEYSWNVNGNPVFAVSNSGNVIATYGDASLYVGDRLGGGAHFASALVTVGGGFDGGGGTITGNGSAWNSNFCPLWVNYNLAGSTSKGATLVNLNCPVDNIDGGVGGASILNIEGNFGGNNTKGGRAAINISYAMVSPSANTGDNDRQYQAIINELQISVNDGGTAPTSGQSAGFCYAGGDEVYLLPGATNWSGIIGREIDVSIATGASAAFRAGLQIVAFGTQQGNDYDCAYAVKAVSEAPWRVAFAIGAGSTWPVDRTKGSILKWTPTIGQNSSNPDIPSQALSGVDFSGVLFSQASFRASGGFSVSGQGTVQVGVMQISSTPFQTAIDPSGSILAAISLNNGGNGYVAGDQLFDDYQSIYSVGSVNSNGTITAITVIVPGSAQPSPPATISLHGGTGANAAVNATWTAGSSLGLTLAPSGGNIRLGTTAALPAAAVSGFPIMPSLAGPPTGAAPDGAFAKFGGRLYVRDGGVWKSTALA